MKQPESKHYCPLFEEEIYWGGCGGCYEVQEVREGGMDVELFPVPIDIEKANSTCESCNWFCENG